MPVSPRGRSDFAQRHDISAVDSLGLSFGEDGMIHQVVPGMIGDRAGLAPGMKVIGVNNKTFSRQRLLDALADSVALRKIELLLIEGERFRTIVLDYADGPRYLQLVRERIAARHPRRNPQTVRKPAQFAAGPKFSAKSRLAARAQGLRLLPDSDPDPDRRAA